MNEKEYLTIPEFSEGRLRLLENESKLKVSCGFLDEWWKIGMTIDIKIRNPLTKEKTVLYAFSKEQAKKMIKSALEEGWYVTVDDNTEDIINELRREKNISEEKKDFGEDMLDFKTWRERDNPGWYLSRESDESVFERYLDYVHQFKLKESDLEEDGYELCD